ncbi:MAG: histidine phosphatase family protein [Firmicutes bacterium]|nr:histidine phosphatase family protein [Bacillota bacterium]
MDNLQGKTLWVMRHGRPNVPPNPLLMTKQQFNEYLEQYDLAGLSDAETARLTALYQTYPVPELVIASDLPRARETADLFAKGAPIVVDPLFREIPVWVPDASTWFLDRRWPSELWWSYLRFAWFYDIPPEGQKRSYERSREAIKRIMEYQKDVQTMAVVSHSGFLLVSIHLLMQQGRLRGRRLPSIKFGLPSTYQWR